MTKPNEEKNYQPIIRNQCHHYDIITRQTDFDTETEPTHTYAETMATTNKKSEFDLSSRQLWAQVDNL